VILGAYNANRSGPELEQELLRVIGRTPNIPDDARPVTWAAGPVALAWVAQGMRTFDEPGQPYQNQNKTITLVFEGKIYNLDEIATALGERTPVSRQNSGQVIIGLYERFGDRFLDHLNGKFSFALWDARHSKLLIVRDRLGIEPLFYCEEGGTLKFGSSLRAFLSTGFIEAELCHDAVVQYLLYCYNPAEQTILRGVRNLRAGHIMAVSSAGREISRYWHLSFADTFDKTEQQYQEEAMELIEDAVRIRLDPDDPPAIFLSGGTDSSTLVGIASKMTNKPLRTFGFRCVGPQYDESPYAQYVADHFGVAYSRVDYEPDKLTLIEKAVDWMDEPFCDLGIEIGTFLMGGAAAEHAGYVFSGEGGDELFAGHPVYVADNAAAFVDIFPKALVRPIARILQKIPDSEQKKDLKVKLKRFAYSVAFPKELLSHRWRIYYTPEELRELCTPEFLAECELDKLYDGIKESMQGSDGHDHLAHSLYSDYYTLVSFYLSRLRLLRAYSLESRLPLLDHRLVEYAAKIPSALKIKGMSDTKYIYKKILEPLLPRKILYDRPKLGHGVPMKNWFRDDPEFTNWTSGVLSNGELQKRGFFRPSFVERMLDEHKRKVFNHSHRIWALLVLDLWLAKHMPCNQ